MKYLFSILLMTWTCFFILVACKNNTNNNKNVLEEQNVNSELDSNSTSKRKNKIPTSSIIKLEEDNISSREVQDIEVENIRAKFKEINDAIADGSLRKDLKQFDCADEPGGGELVRYFKNGKIVMMSYVGGGEHYWEEKQFYFSEGELFFVFELEGSWSFGGPYNEEKPNTIDQFKETRYYLKDNKIIKHLEKEYEDKSWEVNKKSEQIPNKIIKVNPNMSYPNLNFIPDFKAGKVGC